MRPPTPMDVTHHCEHQYGARDPAPPTRPCQLAMGIPLPRKLNVDGGHLHIPSRSPSMTYPLVES